MKTLSPKMDELLAPPTNMLLPSFKIRRVQSLDRLSGDSLECKMRWEGGSFMDLATVEHEIDHDFAQRILVLRLKQKREDAYKGTPSERRICSNLPATLPLLELTFKWHNDSRLLRLAK